MGSSRRRRPTPFASVADAEQKAKRRLPTSIYDRLSVGVDRSVTFRANMQAFDEVMFRPRVATSPPVRDLTTTVLGQSVTMPVLIGPVGNLRLLHPDGARAAVRAAAAEGTICGVSMLAGHSMEEIRAAAGGPVWQQLYLDKGREFAEAVIGMARDAGYSALVVTVDMPVIKPSGRIRVGLKSAVRYGPELMMRPRWFAGFVRDGMRLAATNEVLGVGGAAPQPPIIWDDLKWIRDAWAGPLVVKGVVTSEDARQAVDRGADAVTVSNHGGVLFDGLPPTLRVLPEVVAAVGDSVEVYVDGGIRQGTDVVKALALGARAVLIGRAYLWGLAVSGEVGIRGILQVFRTELDRALAYVGCPAVVALDSSYVSIPDDFSSVSMK